MIIIDRYMTFSSEPTAYYLKVALENSLILVQK